MFLSQVFAPQKGWIADPSRSGGGVVANISSHLLFVLQWALGTPAKARATAKKIYGVVEDELSGTFTLESGAEIGFETSWSVKGYPLSDTVMEIEGANGRLRATNDLLELDLREARNGWPSGRTLALAGDIGGPARFDLNGEGYWLEDARFLAWVAGAPAPPGTALAGYEVQRMMSALYQSADASGATVEVPR
jgi:predicted dehydrogenase